MPTGRQCEKTNKNIVTVDNSARDWGGNTKDFFEFLFGRNGLRPSRFYVTKDNMMVMASEVGVYDTPPSNVALKVNEEINASPDRPTLRISFPAELALDERSSPSIWCSLCIVFDIENFSSRGKTARRKHFFFEHGRRTIRVDRNSDRAIENVFTKHTGCSH